MRDQAMASLRKILVQFFGGDDSSRFLALHSVAIRQNWFFVNFACLREAIYLGLSFLISS